MAHSTTKPATPVSTYKKSSILSLPGRAHEQDLMPALL